MSPRMSPRRNFSSLLDDLFDLPIEADVGVRPLVFLDYLQVAEELHAGRIKVTQTTAAAEYESSGAQREEAVPLSRQVPPAASEMALPPAEPEAVARELDLARRDAAGLAQLRRDFAFRNHPDRVPAHLRARASARMQIANAMIDEAECRLAKR